MTVRVTGFSGAAGNFPSATGAFSDAFSVLFGEFGLPQPAATSTTRPATAAVLHGDERFNGTSSVRMR
jgi:hypothetical protein